MFGGPVRLLKFFNLANIGLPNPVAAVPHSCVVQWLLHHSIIYDIVSIAYQPIRLIKFLN